MEPDQSGPHGGRDAVAAAAAQDTSNELLSEWAVTLK